MKHRLLTMYEKTGEVQEKKAHEAEVADEASKDEKKVSPKKEAPGEDSKNQRVVTFEQLKRQEEEDRKKKEAPFVKEGKREI